MSPIAKLFTIVNVVLAGLFLGFAASLMSTTSSARTDHQNEVKAHTATRDSLTAEKNKVTTEKQEAERTRDQMRNERDDERARAERAEQRLADEERRNNEMRAQVATIAASIDNLTAQSKALQESKDKAVQAQRDAERARDAAAAAQRGAEEKVGGLETSLHTAEGQIADLEKELTSSRKEATSLQTQLASLSESTGAKLGDFSPMPLIEGRVLDVSMAVEPGLVAINKGSADKVVRGYTFEIYDGRTYKGQVRVEYVHANMCSALIIRAVPGQKIRQGDSASTRL